MTPSGPLYRSVNLPLFSDEQALADMQVNKELDTVVYIHPRLAVIYLAPPEEKR